jgi:hypothetical protein
MWFLFNSVPNARQTDWKCGGVGAAPLMASACTQTDIRVWGVENGGNVHCPEGSQWSIGSVRDKAGKPATSNYRVSVVLGRRGLMATSRP